MKRSGTLHRFATCPSGAAAIEFALVALPLFMLLIGGVEISRAMDLHNQLRRAADVAARAVMMEPTSSVATVRSAMQAVLHVPDRSPLSVTLTRETINGLNYVLIEASFPFATLAPITSLRSATITVRRRAPSP
jgi:Flp pilus assembly protein TadG